MGGRGRSAKWLVLQASGRDGEGNIPNAPPTKEPNSLDAAAAEADSLDAAAAAAAALSAATLSQYASAIAAGGWGGGAVVPNDLITSPLQDRLHDLPATGHRGQAGARGCRLQPGARSRPAHQPASGARSSHRGRHYGQRPSLGTPVSWTAGKRAKVTAGDVHRAVRGGMLIEAVQLSAGLWAG